MKIVNINEIAPRFEELAARLEALDAALCGKVATVEGDLRGLRTSQTMRLNDLGSRVGDIESAMETVVKDMGESAPPAFVESPFGDPDQGDATVEPTETAQDGSEPPAEASPVVEASEDTDVVSVKEGEAEFVGVSEKLKTALAQAETFKNLTVAIEEDVVEYSASDIATALISHPELSEAREYVMHPETGRVEKMQAFRFTDGTYRVPTREMFQRIVDETKIDEIEWVAEKSDCEDISLRFNARCIELGLNSCGRVMSWSGGHCFIIAVVRDEEGLGFACLEPQTDKILSSDELGEGSYSLENCLILIN